MTQQIFLSIDARQRESWREAFPGLVAARLEKAPVDPGIIWVLQPAGEIVGVLIARLRSSLAGRPIIIMADVPSENDAMAALTAGASGYCNGHAAPEVLLQIAQVVENGGLWVGQALLQRLLSSAGRLLPEKDSSNAVWRESLTAREQEVALLLAKGESNKEIARDLDITERTVKAHVGAMFEKLGVRDRLQLALIVNGVEQ